MTAEKEISKTHASITTINHNSSTVGTLRYQSISRTATLSAQIAGLMPFVIASE